MNDVSETGPTPSAEHPVGHHHDEDGSHHVHGSLGALALGALGVVYGDIGTSPLYALRECFIGPHAVGISNVFVVGVLSLIDRLPLIVVLLK